MKKLSIIGIIAAAAIFSSCTVTEPLTFSEAPLGNKTGTSSTMIIFGNWHLNKNFGIAEAARNGMIKGGIGAADIETTTYFGITRWGRLFYRKTIIVHGN